nr:hypothetical protein [uncultured Prevotella sp.]
MSLFLLLYFVCFAIIAKKSNYKVFCNVNYWLSVFWILIIGVFFTSGIAYKNGCSPYVWLFIFMCLLSFYCGSSKSKKVATSIFNGTVSKFSIKKYCILGVLGTFLYSFDYLRLNGIATAKGDSNISLLGSLGSLFVPITLVLGLYLNARSIKLKGKFNIWGVVLIIGYTIPCMLNAGRESILFGIIGILCLYGYSKKIMKNRTDRNGLSKKNMRLYGYSKNIIKNRIRRRKLFKKYLFLFLLGVCVLILVFLMIKISLTRFTDNEINVLLSARNISMEAITEASAWGSFEFLYYNIASYFSHQIPFLDLTLREYDGPYLLGCYELNIISRRLPDFLGLDYKLVSIQLERIYVQNGEEFSGCWNTVLGSLISDFTWVGTIFVCFWCGYINGLVKRKFQLTLDPRYATLVALFCLSTFSTIQLGPFFQTQIYGTYIWWYIFFRKEETKRIGKKTKRIVSVRSKLYCAPR